MQSNSLSRLNVQYLPIKSLKPHPSNARTHSTQQIRQIAKSIQCFGFTNPLLTTRDRIIIAGHGRLEAAIKLGFSEVPTILLEDLTEQQIRAYIIADNRLAEKAGWNKETLAIELQHLILNDDSLDVTVTGFEIAEVDLIIQDTQTHSKELDTDDIFEIDEISQPVTKLGDIWKAGEHRLLCGNSLHDSSFASLMDRRQANLVFADPPYNVPIQGHVSGNGKISHREFVMASGELNEVEFAAFLTTSLGLLAKHSTAESVHFICMDWRHLWNLLGAGKHVYDALLNVCVWAKNTAGMGSLYRSQHEFILVFRNGKGFVALLADWGGDNPAARHIAIVVRKQQPDLAIHLGDIYYGGAQTECEAFLQLWPLQTNRQHPKIGVRPGTSYALNGNHEMYSGGEAYFDIVLKAFGQPQPFFCLETEYWRIIGLDTAYAGGRLKSSGSDDPISTQWNWLIGLLRNSGQKKNIFLTHHQPVSAHHDEFQDSAQLRKDITDLLSTEGVAADAIFGWFFGHEHRCALYRDTETAFNARLIGNGCIPHEVQAEKEADPGCTPVDYFNKRQTAPNSSSLLKNVI